MPKSSYASFNEEKYHSAFATVLREELLKHPDLPEVEVGAEVYFFSGISHSEVLEALTIGKNGVF